MKKNHVFRHARLKLTGVYLAIIMIIALIFSGVIYQLTLQEVSINAKAQRRNFNEVIRRRFGDPADIEDVNFREKQIERDASRRILARLLLLNIGLLSCAGITAYILADKTLQPIEKAHEAQKRFVSDAAHELRTPLSALKIENEVTLRTGSKSIEELTNQIKSNIEEVDRLELLSASLLDISRVESSNVIKEVVALSTIIQSSISHIEKAAKNKNINIVVENNAKKVSVYGHKDSLIKIITILLENAVKYSPPGKEVSLETTSRKDAVSIKVIDNGKGIDKIDLPHIFERFYRADASRTTKGHGLGLALAKELAEAQNANISVISSIDKGSTFVLSLSQNS